MLRTSSSARVSHATDLAMLGLARPAQRALQSAGIRNLHQLKNADLAMLKELHGIGPNALARIKYLQKHETR